MPKCRTNISSVLPHGGAAEAALPRGRLWWRDGRHHPGAGGRRRRLVAAKFPAVAEDPRVGRGRELLEQVAAQPAENGLTGEENRRLAVDVRPYVERVTGMEPAQSARKARSLQRCLRCQQLDGQRSCLSVASVQGFVSDSLRCRRPVDPFRRLTCRETLQRWLRRSPSAPMKTPGGRWPC